MQNDSTISPISVSKTNETCPYAGIGASFNPLSDAYMANPYTFLAQARQSEPIFFSPMLNAWVLTRYDDIKTVLKDPEHFSSLGTMEAIADYAPATLVILGASKSILNHVIVNVDPPQHTHIRASLSKAFSPRQIARYEPFIRQLTNQLIDQFISDGKGDILQLFYTFPVLVISHLMGIPEADLELVQTGSCGWIELLFSKLPPERQIEYAHRAVAYENYIEALIEQRRAEPQNDLTSDLIIAIDRDEIDLTWEELPGQIFDIVLASNETSIGLLGNCLHHVLSDRFYWQTIREQPELIPYIVEETLRFNGSVVGVYRVTTETVELGGVTLPKGTHVMGILNAANHDEAQFPDPEVFNPRRENLGRHMGFGSGIHVCLGAALVRLEMRVLLEVLSTRLPSLRLMPKQELHHKPCVDIHSLTQLLVEWDVD